MISNTFSEAVLDRETGLVWQRTPGGEQQFFTAQLLCSTATTGGRQGWRLPSLHELQSLIDPSVTAPYPSKAVALPAGHPFVGVSTASFWTGTSDATDTTAAYVTSIVSGAGPGIILKTMQTRFWCVRGGGPISVY